MEVNNNNRLLNLLFRCVTIGIYSLADQLVPVSPQEAPGEFVSFGVFADSYEQGGQVLGLQDFSLQTLLQQPELIIKKSLTIKHWELQIQLANYVS